MDSPFSLAGENLEYVEQIYELFLKNPNSVSKEWKDYFEANGLNSGSNTNYQAHQAAKDEVIEAARRKTKTGANYSQPDSVKQVAVLQLINAYRFRGHRNANLDPLNQYERPEVPELDPSFHGLFESDMDKTFNTGSLQGIENATLREILKVVRDTYCQNVGAEYMHIVETAEKRWIQQQLEPKKENLLRDERRKQLLRCIIAAGSLERYLHKKYVGQKRFSLEGGESTIALLDTVVEECGKHGVKECVLGMAHRGRLNVLVNIIGKHPSDLFDEFEGKGRPENLSGDVKYHLGYSSDIQTPSGPVHLTLAFNPSHLEIIDPVVEGSVRARQDRRRDSGRNEVLPLLLHGDAAFAGQGVVMETFNLSQTRGYSTGGSLHVIINNQIGFTTSEPLDSRSTLYCTDVAKMIQAPIFHVNADDPDAVANVAKIALDFRMEFNKDVIIDLICYRKHGHSETDEPATTQPIMYKKIRNHPGTEAIYSDKLTSDGVLREDEATEIRDQYIRALEDNQVVSRPYAELLDNSAINYFFPFLGSNWESEYDSALNAETISLLGTNFTQVPSDFQLHRQSKRVLEDRKAMCKGDTDCDWGFAETLAYASLLSEGCPVRISGQDCGRGTFSHRHAVLNDQSNGEAYLPLQNIDENQADFLVINSTLSEEAVLAFEFGYAAAEPNALVVWEAQFGDFANGAQVVIDQFIASSEEKWDRYCGLVLFLPHGYDGQGPEHSSARLERFLQLCAAENMQVCYPTTPSQLFHMLRRQIRRPYRKPLVVMTPKSLLRKSLSFSPLKEFTQGKYQPVLDETDKLSKSKVKKIILCSGKIYFDLYETRSEYNIKDCAIIRLEQFHPFPKAQLQNTLSKYKNAAELIWVQEEPRNQGAWSYLLSRRHLGGCFDESKPLKCVARPYSSSPAVGYLSLHEEQQKKIIAEALDLQEVELAKKKSA